MTAMDQRPPGALAVAIERKEWTLAALCLLLGVADAASRLPPETLDALLELLEEGRGPAACVERRRGIAARGRRRARS